MNRPTFSLPPTSSVHRGLPPYPPRTSSPSKTALSVLIQQHFLLVCRVGYLPPPLPQPLQPLPPISTTSNIPNPLPPCLPFPFRTTYCVAIYRHTHASPATINVKIYSLPTPAPKRRQETSTQLSDMSVSTGNETGDEAEMEKSDIEKKSLYRYKTCNFQIHREWKNRKLCSTRQ